MLHIQRNNKIQILNVRRFTCLKVIGNLVQSIRLSLMCIHLLRAYYHLEVVGARTESTHHWMAVDKHPSVEGANKLGHIGR